ncbi:MAG: starch-binding protein [Ruminococcus sp.]|nr:starch-binding protein [Ruminococcus sp.]
MKNQYKNRFKLALSAAALLLIAVVAVGITFSWIEGGSSLLITNGSNNVKTADFSGEEANYYNGLIMDPGLLNASDTVVDITKFDKNTKRHQDLYFSQMYSNGTSFILPSAYEDGVPSAYREANTDDIGTKFIKFNFRAKVPNNVSLCYLALAEMPTLTITKDGQPIRDSSAFRIMIKDEGLNGNTAILTTADSLTDQNTTVVTDTAGNTGTVNLECARDYVYNNDTHRSTKRFGTYVSGRETSFTVAVWLDGTQATPNLLGADVDVSIKLKVCNDTVNISLNPRTFSSADVLTSAKGGTIKFKSYAANDSDHTYLDYRCSEYEEDPVTAVATAKQGYTFIGWYSNSACTNLVQTEPSLDMIPSQDRTYYAKFKTSSYTVTAVASVSGTTQSTVGGSVQLGSDSSTLGGSVSQTLDHGGSVTFTAVTNSGYIFDGWYNEIGTERIPGGTSETITLNNVSASTTIYARFVRAGKVIRFINTEHSVEEWNNVYAFAWDSSGRNVMGDWPGTLLTESMSDDFGSNYVVNVPNSAVGIVFNTDPHTQGQDRPQTVDLEAVDGACYSLSYLSNSKWHCVSWDTTGKYVRFKNTESWGEVCIYAWAGDEDNRVFGDWPGVPVVCIGFDERFKAIYAAYVPQNATGMVFNGKSGTRRLMTEDLVPVHNRLYYPTSRSTDWDCDDWTIEEKYVQFKNVDNWSNVYIYTWDSNDQSLSGDWPGTPMTSTGTQDGGKDVYEFLVPSNAKGIIFNGGSNQSQTIDILSPTFGKRYYPSGWSGNKRTCSTTDVPGKYVQFTNNNNWSPVKVLAWTSDNTSIYGSGGKTMTLVGDNGLGSDNYGVLLPDNATKVRFTNGSGQQTDLEFPESGMGFYIVGQSSTWLCGYESIS